MVKLLKDMEQNYDMKTSIMPDNWVSGMQAGGDAWYASVAQVLGTSPETVRNSPAGRAWSNFLAHVSEKKEAYARGIKGKGAKLVRNYKRKFGL